MDIPFARRDFHKSSYSEPNENCVEIAHSASMVELRDAKTMFGSPDDVRIQVSRTGFIGLVNTVKRIQP